MNSYTVMLKGSDSEWNVESTSMEDAVKKMASILQVVYPPASNEDTVYRVKDKKSGDVEHYTPTSVGNSTLPD